MTNTLNARCISSFPHSKKMLSDLHQTTFLIKKDDKFYSRLLSRELSMTRSTKNSSFRGLPSSVPFTWESQPGTPKHRFYSADQAPPPRLTPPPSYYSSHIPTTTHTSSRSNNKILILLKIIKWPWSSSKDVYAAHLSSPSISSFSSSFASPARGRTRLGSWGGSSSSSSGKVDYYDDESDGKIGSKTSTMLCFMIKRRRSKSSRSKEIMSMGSL